jgi:hypothetical protein
MKIKTVKYEPLITKCIDGLPTFWLVKKTYYFGWEFDFEYIGRDRYGREPFLTIEEMEEKIKQLGL